MAGGNGVLVLHTDGTKMSEHRRDGSVGSGIASVQEDDGVERKRVGSGDAVEVKLGLGSLTEMVTFTRMARV